MINFSNKNINIATAADAAAITVLLNSAYRGEQSKKGWTTEADLIQGNIRSTVENVTEIIEKEGSNFLVSKNEQELIACVNLQQHNQKIYLGMFAVKPILQGGGIGKALLHAAEEWCLYKSCSCIYMTVVNVRTELIDWYCRHGYTVTDKIIPFEEDGISGTHNQPLFFVELEKQIS